MKQILLSLLLLILGALQLNAQCTYGQESTGNLANPTACYPAYQTFNLGGGAYKYINTTPNTYYWFDVVGASPNTDEGRVCVQGVTYTGAPTILVTATSRYVGTYRNSTTWSTTSATLRYAERTPSVTINQGASVTTCDGRISLGATTTYDYNGASWLKISGSGSINASTGEVTGIAAGSSGYFRAQANNGSCNAYDYITVYHDDIVVSPTTNAPSCNGDCDGSVDLNISGGTPPYVLNEFSHNFDGTSISSIFTRDNIGVYTQNDELSANTTSYSWNKYFYTNQTFARAENKAFTFQYFNGDNNWNMIGWHGNGNTSTTRYQNLIYAFYFYNGGLNIYEDGASRGNFNANVPGGYTQNTWYDCKIVLKAAGGANYYIKKRGTTAYSLVYSSVYSTESNLRLGFTYLRYNLVKTDNWVVSYDLNTASPSVFGLCPGSYTYNVVDQNGCSQSVTAVVPASPSALSLTATPSNETCPGDCDGSVSLSGSGGTSPYTYAGPSIMTDHFSGNDEGLILHLPLDDGTNDVSPTNQGSGTNVGGITFANGVADFSSGTRSINMGAKNAPYLTKATTISYWIYSNNVGSPSRQNPFDHAYGGWGTQTLETNGAISWFFGNNGGNANTYGSHSSGAGFVTAGSWIMVTCVRDPSTHTYRWYKNGALVTSGSYNNTFPVIANRTLTIGDGYVNSINGRMDDFRIYNRALSAAEIQDLYNRSLEDYVFQEGGGTLSHQNGEFKLNNNNTAWDMQIFTKQAYTNSPGLTFQGQFKMEAGGGTRNMVGWHDGTLGGNMYTNLEYAIYMDQTTYRIYENGAQKNSNVGTFVNNQWYDLKIEITATGAKYYSKLSSSSTWNLLYTSTYVSPVTNLRPGCTPYGPNGNYFDNWNVTSAMDDVANLCPGTYNYTVIDANGCTATQSATVGTDNTESTIASSANGATTICVGGAASLSVSGGSLGSGASWRWYANSCGGIFVGTGSSVSVSPTSTTTYFVRAEGICGNTLCRQVTVTVVPDPVINLTGSTTICSGGSELLLAPNSGGTGLCSFQWQISSTGTSGPWSNISGATNDFYDTGPLTATRSYRVIKTCAGNGCNAATSNGITVTVVPDPTLSASGSTTICSGGNATLTSSTSGGTGTCFYLWQVSSVGTSGPWTSIGATNSPTYNTGPLTGTRYYRVNISCTGNGCFSPYSNAVTVTVVPDPTISAAGSDLEACLNEVVTLGANNPSVGSGTWTWSPSAPTYIGGTSANDYNAQVVFNTPGSYTGTWTISNSPCSSSVDNLLVDVYSVSANAYLVSGSSTTAIDGCEEGPWTYYADPAKPDEYIFGIRKNTNVFTANVTINDLPGSATYSSTGGAGPDRGTWLLGRYWNVEITSGSVTAPVDIRFFVDPAEITQAQNEANAFLNSTIFATNITPLSFFKTTGTNFDPATAMVGGDFTFTPTYLPYSINAVGGVAYIEMTGITSFSGGTGGFSVNDDGATLPVELLSFDATAVDNEFIRLDWATATEINNDGFELLRSTDGISFERIAWIEGNGNSTNTHEYVYDDYEVAKGITYYYQLKQIDYDGEFEYFDIVSARLEGRNDFNIGNIVPNPSKENMTVSVAVQSTSEELMTIQIFNHVGVQVASTTKPISSGVNNLKIEIRDLAAGTYFINFEGTFGMETRKLVIIK